MTAIPKSKELEYWKGKLAQLQNKLRELIDANPVDFVREHASLLPGGVTYYVDRSEIEALKKAIDEHKAIIADLKADLPAVPASEMSESLQSVSGAYLYERWQLSERDFVFRTLRERLRAGLLIHDEFGCLVPIDEIDRIQKRIERYYAEIEACKTVLKDELEKSPLVPFPGRDILMKTLQNKQSSYAQFISNVFEKLKYWRYPLEPVRDIEKRWPDLVPCVPSKTPEQIPQVKKLKLMSRKEAGTNRKWHKTISMCHSIKEKNPAFTYEDIAHHILTTLALRKALETLGFKTLPSAATIVRRLEGEGVSKPGPQKSR